MSSSTPEPQTVIACVRDRCEGYCKEFPCLGTWRVRRDTFDQTNGLDSNIQESVRGSIVILDHIHMADSAPARRFLTWPYVLIATGVLAGALLFVTKWANTHTAGGPVIVVSIDTLRADRLPAYGYTQGVTPTIDQLARDGVLFENAYAHSPQTLPSHTSILTGRLPFAHGVRDNVGFVVPDGTVTLAHRLKTAGYATGAFVSSFVLRRQVGLDRGFDTYDDQLPAAGPDRPLGMVQRAGTDTATAAVAWLRAQTSSKYFLFFHIYEPHAPYTPPVVPASGDRYDGEVTYADTIVGQVIAALRERGEYDEATIVLLSDHGEGLGDHGEDEHGLFLYRSTIHTPLIIKRPGAIGAGRRVSPAVQHIDLVPTLLELTALTPDPALTGRSLVTALDGATSLPAATIYAEAMSPRYHFGWSELYALTDDRYRLIRAPRDELFDLASDPGETSSIVADRAQVHAAMRGALDTLIAGTTVSAPSAVSASDRQRLAALGYVGSQTTSRPDDPTAQRADPKDKVGVLRQYQQASALAAEGRWVEASGAYAALLQSEPDMVDGWLQLASTSERAGRRAEALEAYRQVINRDGKNAAALIGAAALYVQAGRFDDARAHAELAVDVAPASAHELLARLALQRGDTAAARTHAASAKAADPTLPMPEFVEGLMLYNSGAYAAAIPPLTRAVQALAARTEQIADVRFVLADALAREQRFAEAEPLFQAEIAAFPHHIRARTGLAMVFWTTGRRAQAITTVQALESEGRRHAGAEADLAAAQLWTLFEEPVRAAAARGRLR
jgi:tetratricopeptide (TPR) repeat protein